MPGLVVQTGPSFGKTGFDVRKRKIGQAAQQTGRGKHDVVLWHFGIVPDVETLARQAFDEGNDFIETGRCPGHRVEYTRHAFSENFHDEPRNVAHIEQIPSLASVAMHDGRFAVPGGIEKRAHRPMVRIAWTVHAGQAQNRQRDPLSFAAGVENAFRGQFAGGIWTLGPQRAAFVQRQGEIRPAINVNAAQIYKMNRRAHAGNMRDMLRDGRIDAQRLRSGSRIVWVSCRSHNPRRMRGDSRQERFRLFAVAKVGIP